MLNSVMGYTRFLLALCVALAAAAPAQAATDLFGYLAAAGKDYRVFITTGRAATTGRILTPTGEYALQSEGDSTWLVDHGAAGVRTLIGDVKDTRAVPAFGPPRAEQPASETKAAT